MTASIDGSEEVWSAILASILTHIAVFVPLLFLDGVSSIMFRQLSVVVVFSLLMSLFVAVTLVPVLCSKLLVLPPPADKRSGLGGRLYTLQRADAQRHGRRLPPAAPPRARPSADRGRRRASPRSSRRCCIFPTHPDRVRRPRPTRARCRSASSSRRARASSSPTPCCSGSRQMIAELVPEATDVIVNARRRRRLRVRPGGGGSGNRGNIQMLLKPKDERTRSSEQIAHGPAAAAVGHSRRRSSAPTRRAATTR